MVSERLTERQADVYATLARFRNDAGRAPTWVEMVDILGFSGPHAVQQYLDIFERKGWIRRKPGEARGVEFLRPAEEAVGSQYADSPRGRACMVLMG